MLVLRAQSLTPAQFLAFARRFGPPEPHVIDQFHHPADPNILILSNRVENGKPLGLADAGTYFHTDYSYLRRSGARDDAVFDRGARARRQHAVRQPVRRVRRPVRRDEAPHRPLLGIHHYGNRNNQDESTRTVASVLTDEQKAKMPLITHPLARAHPVTGRKALYAVSGSSFGIVGMPDDEARALLDELAAHATQPKYQLQPGVRRRRRRHLGQRVAAAFGDARRSRASADAVADHAEGTGAIGSCAPRDRADIRQRRDVAITPGFRSTHQLQGFASGSPQSM